MGTAASNLLPRQTSRGRLARMAFEFCDSKRRRGIAQGSQSATAVSGLRALNSPQRIFRTASASSFKADLPKHLTRQIGSHARPTSRGTELAVEAVAQRWSNSRQSLSLPRRSAGAIVTASPQPSALRCHVATLPQSTTSRSSLPPGSVRVAMSYQRSPPAN